MIPLDPTPCLCIERHNYNSKISTWTFSRSIMD